MQFRSTLKGFEPTAVRRMLSWVAAEIGHPMRLLTRADFINRSRGASGRCYGVHRIAVRLTPRDITISFTRFGIDLTTHDRWELLVWITAHEIAHAHDFAESRKTNERSAEMQAKHVLEQFRAERVALLAAWCSEPAKRVAKPVPLVQERRQSKALDALSRWQRRLKLAQTKVKQYKRKAAYYEKALAAKRGS